MLLIALRLSYGQAKKQAQLLAECAGLKVAGLVDRHIVNNSQVTCCLAAFSLCGSALR